MLETNERILFFDTEVTLEGKRLYDMGAITSDGKTFHGPNRYVFKDLVNEYKYLCGHNIFEHDLKYIEKDIINSDYDHYYIDTLLLSPLFFPSASHHNLLKDDKLQTGDINNPLSDAVKAKDLFYEELTSFNALKDSLKNIYCLLLKEVKEFAGFFRYVNPVPGGNVLEEIKKEFKGEICENSIIDEYISDAPIELAYCLALIKSEDDPSVIPPWVARNYPKTHTILNMIRNTPCKKGCDYCNNHFDVETKLKHYFGYNKFRLYNDEPLQEKAAKAAVEGKSLLAIFPTGGGKSLTFQLPALIQGDTAHGLTVVISPLQSLMKDQVDSLREKGIACATTINSSLDPIERRDAIEMVENGVATILYIAPESLRSKTVERLLLSRNVVRFVIDEAHCFSAWGQDFRVDYQYIPDFVKKYQEEKRLNKPIPVSCFTATAKPMVISDIREYFRRTCGIELELFATNTTRKNLRYEVLYRGNKEDKIKTLRDLITAKECPTIVYVSRTKATEEIANRLVQSGIEAVPYHGRMEPTIKKTNQNRFMSGEVDVIVATTAFGMGIDKDDVGLVIHYNISTSLEDYVQEAGRAGRDPKKNAECYILFNEDDIDKHFQYLTQTKLSKGEINQVWQGIKRLSRKRKSVCKTPLEIAKAAGWGDTVEGVETKIKTAIAALERAGYIVRGNNVPRVYANGINAFSMIEANEKLTAADYEDENLLTFDRIVLSYLFSRRQLSRGGNDDAESRVDYIADRLGVETRKVIESVMRLREHDILNDGVDMSAIITDDYKQSRVEGILKNAIETERFLSGYISGNLIVSLKELNSEAKQAGTKTSPDMIKSILLFWVMHKYISRTVVDVNKKVSISKTDHFISVDDAFHRANIARFIVKHLYERSKESSDRNQEIPFSILELKNAYNFKLEFQTDSRPANVEDVVVALSFLHTINAMQFEGGFLVFYNALQINRIEMDNKKQYKKDDYQKFEEFYLQKIQQIHIVSEFAHIMLRNYEEAQEFVSDYFTMDYMLFIIKYFEGKRSSEINRSITPEKYNKLFESLSITQRNIIDDNESQNIVVAAGPGSGKTKLLVHKLASLLLMEDTKTEQLLMLTFSRSAASEFKERLIKLIGNGGYYVDIKTFHSFCFDLIGEMGNLAESSNVVTKALDMIRSGQVDTGRLTRTTLVIDEAQDMDADEFALVEALMHHNDSLRVIAVGDDDQNIYEFRNSDSKYMGMLVSKYGASRYELLENYRSCKSIVGIANKYATTIKNRMKSKPIVAVKNEEGLVVLNKLRSKSLFLPTLALIKDTYDSGSCCVMTNTNQEALIMTGMLKQEGYKARLIQSMDGFDVYNLYEMRSFVEMLGSAEKNPIIPDNMWKQAIDEFTKRFAKSARLSECLKMIKSFENTNRRKYYTDFVEFLHESKLEDFSTGADDVILVSTIHKSKGREFDNVYIMLGDYYDNEDYQKHVIYVGMTRARNELYINYNTNVFDRFAGGGIRFLKDSSNYAEPNEASLQLSHRDVNLGYFKYVEGNVRNLCSGDELFEKNGSLYADKEYKRCVLRLSKKAISDIEKLKDKGFIIYRADVRNMVFWKGMNEEKEVLIVLPNLYFHREKKH